MTGNIVIFVTDQRQSNLAACLPGKIHRLDWRRGVEKEEALKVLDNSRYLVLPVPVTKIERNHDVNLILKEELTREKERDWMLFGGIFGPEWRQRCEDAGTEYYDMMTDAVVVHRNACITAEATVAEILKYSDYSIREQKIIVSGYGRCGREIARVLSAMGAKVTVLARSAEARRLARTEGHEAVDFSYGPEEAYGARTVVNTVPAIVISEPMIRELHSDAVLIDIQMPGMYGLKATRILREYARFDNLPIIAMTAHAMNGDREKSLSVGMQDYIAKPIEPSVLLSTLARWIHRDGRSPRR